MDEKTQNPSTEPEQNLILPKYPKIGLMMLTVWFALGAALLVSASMILYQGWDMATDMKYTGGDSIGTIMGMIMLAIGALFAVVGWKIASSATRRI